MITQSLHNRRDVSDVKELVLRTAMELLEADCPPQHRAKLRRMMEFAPPGLADEVADPYYGGKQGFETVLDHIESACDGVLRYLQAELDRRPS